MKKSMFSSVSRIKNLWFLPLSCFLMSTDLSDRSNGSLLTALSLWCFVVFWGFFLLWAETENLSFDQSRVTSLLHQSESTPRCRTHFHLSWSASAPFSTKARPKSRKALDLFCILRAVFVLFQLWNFEAHRQQSWGTKIALLLLHVSRNDVVVKNVDKKHWVSI